MNVASKGRRILAFLLDGLLTYLLIYLISLLVVDKEIMNEMVNLYTQLINGSITDVQYTEAIMALDITSITNSLYYQLAALAVYYVIIPSYYPYQTLGRAIAKIKVLKLTHDENKNPSFGTFFLREAVGKFLIAFVTCGMSTFISAFMILGTPSGRGIHDRIAKTIVVSTKVEEPNIIDV